MVSETLIDGLLCADWFLEGSKWEIFFGGELVRQQFFLVLSFR